MEEAAEGLQNQLETGESPAMAALDDQFVFSAIQQALQLAGMKTLPSAMNLQTDGKPNDGFWTNRAACGPEKGANLLSLT